MLFSRQMEYSKKLAFFDSIIYIVFVIATTILTVMAPGFISIYPDILTIFTTGFITLRLGYTAKSGVENYKKIQNTMRPNYYIDEDEELG